MGRAKTTWILAAAALFLLTARGRGADVPDSTTEAASTLFREFETVSYVKADMLPQSGRNEYASKSDIEIVSFPFVELTRALNVLGEHVSGEMLRDSEAVMLGAKDFRAPAGLGAVRSRRCYIVLLKGGSTFELRKYFSEAPSDSAADMPVWRWTANLGEYGEEDSRPSRFFITQIGKSYLLISNSRDEIQATALGLASAKNLTVLSRVRNWKVVSQHSFWYYRRYAHGGNIDQDAAGTSLISADAEALIFFVDYDKTSAVLRLIGSAATEGISGAIADKMKLRKLAHRSPGVWEAEIAFRGNDKSYDQLIAILHLLGFGTYV